MRSSSSARASGTRALSPSTVGLLFLLVTSLGWGLNWPAMKLLLREWPPLFARGCAGIVAALLLALIALVRRESLTVPRPLIRPLVLSAFFNIFAWMGFSTLSMQWLNAGQGALLVYTMPGWATLLAWPILGKRPTWLSSFGLLLCVAGLAVLFGGGNLSLGADKLPGVFFALAAAFLFALGTVVMKPLALPPFAGLAWQLALGCVPMLVYGLLEERPVFSALSPVGLHVMVYMTLVPMGLCYISWFAALRRLPPSTASVATLLTPVIGVVAAAVSLGEPLGLSEILAMLLTLGGVGLVLRAG